MVKFSYKSLKSHDIEASGKDVCNSNEEGGESRPIAGEASTWQAVANMTSIVQGVETLALPYAVFRGGITTIIGFPLFALVHWYTVIIMIDCTYDDDGEANTNYSDEEIAAASS